MSTTISTFPLTSTTLVGGMGGFTIPLTVTLTSSDVTRNIQVSTDGGLTYIDHPISLTSTTAIVANISTYITNVKVTGAPGDSLSMLNGANTFGSGVVVDDSPAYPDVIIGLEARPLASVFGKGTVTIIGDGYKVVSTSDGISWSSVGSSELLANRPTAALFGKGSWFDGSKTYSSDSVYWVAIKSENDIDNPNLILPFVEAGVRSIPTGTVVSTARGTGFNGYGYAYLRDPQTAFDTVTLLEIKRTAGLTGTDRWNSIVLEVIDMYNEASDVLFYGTGALVLAHATLVVGDTAEDTLSNLVFPMLDNANRPVTLNSSNLPKRFGIRYRALNSGGTAAVCGDRRTDVTTPNTVITMYNSVPARSGATFTGGFYFNGTAWAQLQSTAHKSIGFELSLSTPQKAAKLLEPSGKFLLNNWKARLARINDGQAIAANVMVIGDSWANSEVILSRPIARKLKSSYGDAGPGYLGLAFGYAATMSGGCDSAQASAAQTGAWVNDFSATGKGMDGVSVSSTTVGDSIAITLAGTARRANLFFYRQTTGGTVRWKVGAGAWTSISTAGTTGMASAAIDFGGEITGVTITIEVEVAGASGCILHGIDLQRDVAGVRVHKLGHSGGQASTFVNVGSSVMFAEVSAMAADLAIIVFTTNEKAAGTTPTAMIANIKEICTRIREVRPYCDIVLVSPANNNSESYVYTFSEYETAMYNFSQTWGCGFFPCKTVLGAFGDFSHSVLCTDTVPHPNSAGGELLAKTLINELIGL